MKAAWLRQVGDWVVAVEPGERFRPVGPLMAALSQRGEAIQVSWSTRSTAEFRRAVAGEMVTSFDAFRPQGLDPAHSDLTIPLPGADGGRQAPALLMLAERYTGLPFGLESLDEVWLLLDT